jgi:2-polyprenyl-6-methoxyphenol hydroxylase-like FAD-dependent oxidoreductase
LARRLLIAVIGAGVAGLSHAIMLRRLGHQVVVHERFATSRPLGSGLLIQPTGLVALERLGQRSAIEALGHRIERLQGATTAGRRIFDLGYDTLGSGWYAIAVHRAALHDALWQGFAQSGAAFEGDCDIDRLEERSDGLVALIDRRGGRKPAYDLVIDATGARSPIRAWVTGRQPRPFTYGAVWATVPDTGFAPAALTQRYVAARIMIGHLPVGRIVPGGPDVTALFWSLKPSAYQAWRDGFADWPALVTGLWPDLAPALRSLTGPDDFTLASYQHFTADRLSRGPVVLTGDSAHCTSPQLGQGANHAMIDAVILADALAASDDIATALKAYDAARRRHVRFYQLASQWMTPLFQSDSRLFAGLRDVSFDRLKLLPYLHRQMLETLAGVKTGIFTAASPDRIVNALRQA